jgi:hypothetical protein
MPPQQPTSTLSSAAVLELACLVGIPIDDHLMAERLVAGASSAAAAVRALRARSRRCKPESTMASQAITSLCSRISHQRFRLNLLGG